MFDVQERFTLFHTDGCHLCEIAQQMLDELSIQYFHKDICDDEQLADKYGISIPVLYDSSSNTELFWPFEPSDVKRFIGV